MHIEVHFHVIEIMELFLDYILTLGTMNVLTGAVSAKAVAGAIKATTTTNKSSLSLQNKKNQEWWHLQN